jgi:hypothetical protein
MPSPFEPELQSVLAELTRRFGVRAFSLRDERAPAPGAALKTAPVAPEGEVVPVDARLLLEQGAIQPLSPLPALEAARAGSGLKDRSGPVREVLTFRFESAPGAAPHLEALAQYLFYVLRWRPAELRVVGGGREAAYRAGALMMDLELYRRFRRDQGLLDLAREARLFLPTVEVERWSVEGGLLTLAFRCPGGEVEPALGLLAAVASEALGVEQVRLERLDLPGASATRLVAELMAPTAVEAALTGAERELFVPILRPVLFPSFAGLYRDLLEEGIYVGPIRLEEKANPEAPAAHGSFLSDRAFEPHRFEIAYRDEPLEGAGESAAAIAGPEGFEQVLLRAQGNTYRLDAPDVWRWPRALVQRLLERLVLSERAFSPSPLAGPARIRSVRASVGGARAPVMVRADRSAPWQPFESARGRATLWLHAPPTLSGTASVRLELDLDKPTWSLAPRGAEPLPVDLSALELKVTGASVPVDPGGLAVAQRERAFVCGEAASISVAAEGRLVEVKVIASPDPSAFVPIPLVHVLVPGRAPAAASGPALGLKGAGPPERAWFAEPERSPPQPRASPTTRASASLPAPESPPAGPAQNAEVTDALGAGAPFPDEPPLPLIELALEEADEAEALADEDFPTAVEETPPPGESRAAPEVEPAPHSRTTRDLAMPPARATAPAERPPEPPTVVASLSALSAAAASALGAPDPGPPLALHIEDLDATSNDARVFACIALPLGESGLSLSPDGTLAWKAELADWTLGASEGRVVLRSQSKNAGRLQWTGVGGSRTLRAGETARLRSGDLLEYAGRRWRVQARGGAARVAPPTPVPQPAPAAVRPRAEPVELALKMRGKPAVRAVAIPGGKLGLALAADGTVLWQTRDPAVFRIWVGVDKRLILLRPPVAPKVTLIRGRRSLEVPPKKPVVLLDKDELDTGTARVRLTVLGVAAEVRPPWVEELLAEAEEVTPVDPPGFVQSAPLPAAALGEELEGEREIYPPGAVTLAEIPALHLPPTAAQWAKSRPKPGALELEAPLPWTDDSSPALVRDATRPKAAATPAPASAGAPKAGARETPGTSTTAPRAPSPRKGGRE